jgi:hypothetical protein
LWKPASSAGDPIMKPLADKSFNTAVDAMPQGGLFAPIRLPHALAARLHGPGGLYNIGNFLGLAAGITVQIAHSADSGAAKALVDYLAGDVSAFMLTLATLVFFVSGEAYHRAWQYGYPPDKRLNRLGDLLSAVGALALGVALLKLGQPFLAATAGLLHAAGKLSSAICKSDAASGTDWPWIFRASVLVSRVPAMLAALIELLGHLTALTHGGPTLPALMPATLLVCYVLWAKADLLLFRR